MLTGRPGPLRGKAVLSRPASRPTPPRLQPISGPLAAYDARGRISADPRQTPGRRRQWRTVDWLPGAWYC